MNSTKKFNHHTDDDIYSLVSSDDDEVDQARRANYGNANPSRVENDDAEDGYEDCFDSFESDAENDSTVPSQSKAVPANSEQISPIDLKLSRSSFNPSGAKEGGNIDADRRVILSYNDGVNVGTGSPSPQSSKSSKPISSPVRDGPRSVIDEAEAVKAFLSANSELQAYLQATMSPRNAKPSSFMPLSSPRNGMTEAARGAVSAAQADKEQSRLPGSGGERHQVHNARDHVTSQYRKEESEEERSHRMDALIAKLLPNRMRGTEAAGTEARDGNRRKKKTALPQLSSHHVQPVSAQFDKYKVCTSTLQV